ncbi:MAG: hypothetical protein M3R25_11610 [Bacteroidota bacterium]|nr:hypothetical protein [Bacteroidota bacterium]
MKKVIFSLFFCSFLVLGANAQKATCSKTCTKGSSASACTAKAPGVATTESIAAAAQLASMDASIETRTDPSSGAVTYVRKETCAHSGSVSYSDVNYDATSNTFVNVSPMKMEGASTSKSCSGGSAAGKSCCAGKAGVSKPAEKVKS